LVGQFCKQKNFLLLLHLNISTYYTSRLYFCILLRLFICYISITIIFVMKYSRQNIMSNDNVYLLSSLVSNSQDIIFLGKGAVREGNIDGDGAVFTCHGNKYNTVDFLYIYVSFGDVWVDVTLPLHLQGQEIKTLENSQGSRIAWPRLHVMFEHDVKEFERKPPSKSKINDFITKNPQALPKKRKHKDSINDADFMPFVDENDGDDDEFPNNFYNIDELNVMPGNMYVENSQCLPSNTEDNWKDINQSENRKFDVALNNFNQPSDTNIKIPSSSTLSPSPSLSSTTPARKIDWIHCGDHYKRIDEKFVECSHCGTTLKYSQSGGHLSNLKEHDCFKKVQQAKQQKRLIQTTMDGRRVYGAKLPEEKQNRITEFLLKFIVEDMRPFNLMQSENFKNLCFELCDRYKVPVYNTVKSKLEDFYKEGIIQWSYFLSTLSEFSLSIDLYLCENKVHLLFVYCHYVDEKGFRKKGLFYVYDVSMFAHVDAICLENVFNEIFKVLKIEDKKKVFGFTADAGSNVKKYIIKHIQSNYVHCGAHVLNLIVQNSMHILDDLKIRIKEVVNYFNHYTMAWTILSGQQVRENLIKELDNVVYKLIKECDTRWDSMHDMLDRIHLLFDTINAALLELVNDAGNNNRKNIEDMVMKPIMKMQLEEIIDMLRPFREATKSFSNESTPVLSIIVPTFKLIQHQLMNTEQPVISILGKSLRAELNRNLEKYLQEYLENPLVIAATFLDPRTKSFSNFTSDNLRKVELKCKALEFISKSSSTSTGSTSSKETSVIPNITTPKTMSRLASFFDKKDTSSLLSNDGEGIEKEGDIYEKEFVMIEEDEDLYKFWNLKCHQLPILSSCALKILTVASSSVVCEQGGSIAKRTIDNRFLLDGSTICQLLMLKYHFPRAKYNK